MRALAIAILIFASTGLAKSQTKPAHQFDAATIKPCAPEGQAGIGFHSSPGGRVEIKGVSVKVLMSLAFDTQGVYQISGGLDWIGTDCYNIAAVQPDASNSAESHTPTHTPTTEQRQMLQTLLADRFGLRIHQEIKQGPAYILTRGDKPLQLKEPEDKSREPIFAVFLRGDLADGEVRGANVSMDKVAKVLGSELGAPVLDETGIQGSYDLHIEPFDAENHDVESAIVGAMSRLGLKLKRGTGPVETIFIDAVSRPTPN